MATPTSSKRFCFFFMHFILFLCNSVKSSDILQAKYAHDIEKREVERENEELFPRIHRGLVEYFRYKMTEFDSIDPPTINLPPPPITNPVTAPAISVPPAGIITVPGTNPPVNPVTTPTINPGVTTSPQPSTLPPAGGGGGGGQRWCVAKNGASQAALQSALDYACGIGGADCSTIQQGASCYDPITLQNHASYAFNSYYQKNPVPTSCDFGGTAVVTNVNPSTGSCVYPSSSSSSSPTIPIIPTTPTMQAPVNPTPLSIPTTSSSGSIIPGAVSSPPGFSLDPGTGVGGFGASPPLMNTASVSNYLQPFIILATSMTMGRLMFGV